MLFISHIIRQHQWQRSSPTCAIKCKTGCPNLLLTIYCAKSARADRGHFRADSSGGPWLAGYSPNVKIMTSNSPIIIVVMGKYAQNYFCKCILFQEVWILLPEIHPQITKCILHIYRMWTLRLRSSRTCE